MATYEVSLESSDICSDGDSSDSDTARTPPAGSANDAGPAVYADMAAAPSSAPPPGRGGARVPAAKAAAAAGSKAAKAADTYRQQMKKRGHHARNLRVFHNMMESVEGRLIAAVEQQTALETELSLEPASGTSATAMWRRRTQRATT